MTQIAIKRRIPELLVIAALLASSWSCTGTPGVELPSFPDCAGPIIVHVMVDQTKSMKLTSTETPSVGDFDPLIDKLAACGGYLKVTFIRDRPDQANLRLQFPEPPPLPDKPVKVREEEEYEFNDRMAAYSRQLLGLHDEMVRSRQQIEPSIQGFRRELKDLLGRPMANATDFNSALNDALVFLSVSGDVGWRKHPVKYLIINSDALDEKRKSLLKIPNEADVFWINTSTDDKALEGIRFTRCDDFATAVRRIVNK